MGFWLFMLLMDLLIPITMICFGKKFMNGAPRTINGFFGYRTKRSMKNQETWNYANQKIGKLWYRCGLVLLPLSCIPMFLVFGKSDDTIGTVGGVICALQLVPLVGSIFPIEAALKRKFDENGVQREG